MRVYPRATPSQVADAISARVVDDVSGTLNRITTIENRFIVNDTAWFQRRPNGKITPCVMNAADYISKRFQDILRDEFGWEKEKELRAQTIDNFVELAAVGTAFRVPEPDFPKFFAAYAERREVIAVRAGFLQCWHDYGRVGVKDLSEIESELRPFFAQTELQAVRIGLEFETGNIASAFRALDKLETLFAVGEIDYGVFVTSISKTEAAARIWPQSNRNGSFQKLENRNYRNNRTIPLWEFGFAPDEFRADAPYLGRETLYTPAPTGATITDKGIEFEVWERLGGEQVLRPKSPSLQQNLDTDGV